MRINKQLWGPLVVWGSYAFAHTIIEQISECNYVCQISVLLIWCWSILDQYWNISNDDLKSWTVVLRFWACLIPGGLCCDSICSWRFGSHSAIRGDFQTVDLSPNTLASTEEGGITAFSLTPTESNRILIILCRGPPSSSTVLFHQEVFPHTTCMIIRRTFWFWASSLPTTLYTRIEGTEVVLCRTWGTKKLKSDQLID